MGGVGDDGGARTRPEGACAEDRAARILLGRWSEGGDPRLGARIARAGAPAAAVEILRGASPLANSGDLATRLPRGFPDRGFTGSLEELVNDDLSRSERLGARFVAPGDAEWPTQLDDLGVRAPLGLWLAGGGSLRLLAVRSIAVVGARAATSYGEGIARTLAAECAARGWCVVSGGAFGIDAAAHRGVLGIEGATVCVLACGVDVAYPRSHVSLLEAIRQSGLLVSEAPFGAAAMRQRFLTRNRIIAALTRGTVVVEAALRSGSRTTAREAADLNRHVMAVPGPVTSPMSSGCHALLREGAAALVTTAEDVLDLVGDIGGRVPSPLSGGGDAPPPAPAASALGPREARVLDAVPLRRAAPLASLARVAGIAPTDVLVALGILEASGRVRRLPDGWVRAAA
ncbi:MAG: DNA-processing protein DprA [bacterium]